MFGFSIYCGLAIPNWVNKNPEKLQTGEGVVSPGLSLQPLWNCVELVAGTVTLVSSQGFCSWIRSSRCS